MKKTQSTTFSRPRDINKLLSLQGLIDLRTKSDNERKPKFSRKEKHKNREIY